MATVAELTAKLGLDNSEFKKGMSDSTGQIKDFQSTIKDGLQSLKDMAKSLKEKTLAMQASITSTIAQTKAMSASQLALKATTLATNAFKVALASTGIGAIVIALGSLIAYLTQTEAGMAKMDKVIKPVVQIFERLKGVLQVLGESVFAGIAQMLNGELKEGFKTLANGAKQAGLNTVNAFKDGARFGAELADLVQKIKKEELELESLRGRSRNQIALLSEDARDQSKTEAQRAESARKAIALINELTAKEQSLIKLQVRKLEIEQSANDTDQEGKLEMKRLQNQLLDVEANAASQRTRLNNINAKEQNSILDLIKKTNEERKKEVAIKGGERNAFSLEDKKYSDEVLKNVSNITKKLIDPALVEAKKKGIIFTQEDQDRVKATADDFDKFNQKVALTQSIAGMLGSTFQSAFEGMLNSGKVSFKGIIDGLKALIIKLIAAAAAALILATILTSIKGGAGVGIGMGAKTGGFADIFKMFMGGMSGLNFMAEGGMVTGLTTAILGDNPSGKEAVIPFEKMGSFLSQYGNGGGNMRVEVVGTIKGQDIYLSGSNYSQRRNKILGV